MNQTVTITVELQTEHKPNNEKHLEHVVEEYFRSKGVRMENKVIKV